MANWISVHPLNPQQRLLAQIGAALRKGAVIAYPTDSCYALGCHLGDKAASDRIRAIRQFDKHHLFTLVCRDLSDIATYARVDNAQFRLLKSMTPGPYTFVLQATSEAPRRLQHDKRKTIGLRIPDNAIAQALLDALGEPLLSVTLILPPDELPVAEPEEVRERLDRLVDVVVDGGNCGFEPTTILDLSQGDTRLIRQGKGRVAWLEGSGDNSPG